MIYEIRQIPGKRISKFRAWFHYNKPKSKERGYPQLTLHFKNKCLTLDKITVLCPTESKNNRSQPFCVMQTWAKMVKVENNKAIIG